MGLLEIRQVAGVVDQLDMGARDPLRELVGIGRCDHLILIPQMIKVGTAIRWMRFLRPLSAIGPTNFPVRICDQIKSACDPDANPARGRDGASGGTCRLSRHHLTFPAEASASCQIKSGDYTIHLYNYRPVSPARNLRYFMPCIAISCVAWASAR
jgi:hypothetical protein